MSEFQIDFDRASAKWRENKISTAGGTFKYRCRHKATEAAGEAACQNPRDYLQMYCKKHCAKPPSKPPKFQIVLEPF